MNCTEFRAKYVDFDSGAEIPKYDAWVSHIDDCTACSDWSRAYGVRKRGANPDDFPCVHVADYATMTCDQHPDAIECPDILIVYEPKFDEYSIPVRDGGPSIIVIRHCPWCGVKLPESKRDRWFEELRSLGFDDPCEQDIPEEYLTDKWYKRGS